MIQLICLFTPATLSLLLLTREKKRSLLETLCLYTVLLGLINMLTLAVTSVFSSHADHIVQATLFTVSFSYRYLLLSFVFAWLLPTAYRKIREILRIELLVHPAAAPQDEGSHEA